MYVNDLKMCNGLEEIKCDRCKFYCNKDKQKYILDMKIKGLYLTRNRKRYKKRGV